MVDNNVDVLECMEGTYIKVYCPDCKLTIELCYSDWENTTKPAIKKRICDCGKEWEIKIIANIKE